MSVFDRFDLNFDTTRFGDANILSDNASNTLNLIAATSGKFADWQISSLESGPIDRTDFFQNPTAGNVSSMLTITAAISANANTCNLANVETSATNLILELNRFKSHTDNISGVVLVTSQSVPSYDTALAFGQMSILNLAKSNEMQSNTDVMLGCFTSLFIPDILLANTNQLMVYDQQLANSMTVTIDIITGDPVISSNLSPAQIQTINDYINSTTSVLYTRRTEDWTFYQNTFQIAKDAGFLQQFNNMGGTQSYLVKNIIGTTTLVENLTANTANT